MLWLKTYFVKFQHMYAELSFYSTSQPLKCKDSICTPQIINNHIHWLINQSIWLLIIWGMQIESLHFSIWEVDWKENSAYVCWNSMKNVFSHSIHPSIHQSLITNCVYSKEFNNQSGRPVFTRTRYTVWTCFADQQTVAFTSYILLSCRSRSDCLQFETMTIVQLCTDIISDNA